MFYRSLKLGWLNEICKIPVNLSLSLFVRPSQKISLCGQTTFYILVLCSLSSCSHQTQMDQFNLRSEHSPIQEPNLLLGAKSWGEQHISQLIRDSFESFGIAGVDRLNQDQTQAYCSQQAENASAVEISKNTEQNATDLALMEKIRVQNQSLISLPQDLNYFGDYKRGESIAQDGRGRTWSDSAEQENGGNCYNCHQLSKEELSYGSLGPSLYKYGFLRGVSNLKTFNELTSNPSSSPLVQYTWGVLVNSKAFNVCTVMPRFGIPVGLVHSKAILNENQLKDLMSLLLDPRSPVNQ